jgi:hypothetical protein
MALEITSFITKIYVEPKKDDICCISCISHYGRVGARIICGSQWNGFESGNTGSAV